MRSSALALVVMATVTAAAPAAAQPSRHASCVATVTVFETTIAPGFVGAEVSHLATTDAGVFAGHVTSLAQRHSGSVEGCFGG